MSDSDFIKSLPIHPEKEFEIKKRLDRPGGINNNNNNNSNNNNNNNNINNNSNLFGPGGGPPSIPTIEDFLVNSGRLPPPPPPAPSINLGENLLSLNRLSFLLSQTNLM